jgi:hypothetical protein
MEVFICIISLFVLSLSFHVTVIKLCDHAKFPSFPASYVAFRFDIFMKMTGVEVFVPESAFLYVCVSVMLFLKYFQPEAKQIIHFFLCHAIVFKIFCIIFK